MELRGPTSQRSERSGQLTEIVGEPQILGVVDGAGDNRHCVASQGFVEGREQVGCRAHGEPPGPETFRICHEIGVREPDFDVVAELQFHLPSD